ncbi:MAG: M20/M25/M40 family metallo-hydrolase [Hyphomonadaceae bacterium]|nr:M20/M25/M40 family metallo-hydrolase [Hyphomonadaceae bacterium]
MKFGICVASSFVLLTALACSKAPSTETIETVTPESVEKIVETIDPTVKKLIDASLKSTHAYDITESLTTEIGPRLAGSEAEARARKWAEEKFLALGFSNVKTEAFVIEGWERGIESAAIVSPYPQQLYVTSLGGSVATPEAGITAPVAFFESFEALKNAPEGGLDGKIVYITGKMEKAINGAGYGPANMKRRSGATEAAKRGAVAVLIRSVGTDSHRFPHTGQMRYGDEKKIPIGAVSAPDADQLDRIFASGKDVEISLTMTPKAVGQQTSGNVVGEIVGSEKPEEIIVIGAHLDSWDLGTGAIDDGAGVGIVMGAAKVLMESGLKPKRTIRVVLFGSEEVGLLGARAYAEQHANELDQHFVATESDFGAERVYSIQAGAGDANINLTKEMAPHFKSLGIEFVEGVTTGGPDIIPMAAAGVPAIRLNQDGTDYFDLHHTPDDTFDKIDPDAMAQNVAAYTIFIWLASETDKKFREE